MCMQLTVVRHALTDLNVQGRVQGSRNLSLNVQGREQARKVARALKDMHFDHVYVSDLDRCMQTAKEILRFHPDVAVTYSEQLRERRGGFIEGMPKQEAMEYFRRSGMQFHDWVPEGGESYEGVQSRARVFFEQLLNKHKGQSVLLVSHGALLSTLLIHIFQRPLDYEQYKKYRLDNAAYSIIDISDTKDHSVHVLNAIEHLETQNSV